MSAVAHASLIRGFLTSLLSPCRVRLLSAPSPAGRACTGREARGKFSCAMCGCATRDRHSLFRWCRAVFLRGSPSKPAKTRTASMVFNGMGAPAAKPGSNPGCEGGRQHYASAGGDVQGKLKPGTVTCPRPGDLMC